MTDYWETKPSGRTRKATLELIDRFDARGLRVVYHRGDNFPAVHLDGRYYPRRGYWMDVWATKDGRLLVRFWSRAPKVVWCSFQIHNLKVASEEWRKPWQIESEKFVPAKLRCYYEEWVDIAMSDYWLYAEYEEVEEEFRRRFNFDSSWAARCRREKSRLGL